MEVDRIEDSLVVHFYTRLAQLIGQAVELFLADYSVDNYDGVIQVAAFDQVLFKEELHFVQEDESAARSNILSVVGCTVIMSVLLPEDVGVEIDHGHDLEAIVGQGQQFGAGFFIFIEDGVFQALITNGESYLGGDDFARAITRR